MKIVIVNCDSDNELDNIHNGIKMMTKGWARFSKNIWFIDAYDISCRNIRDKISDTYKINQVIVFTSSNENYDRWSAGGITKGMKNWLDNNF